MRMERYKKYLYILVLIMIFPFMADHVFAEPFKELHSEVLAISLVIDTSGSMLYTDPNRFRQDVANIFIDLLNPEDYLGIITFNSNVDLVIPMEQLKDDEVRKSFKDRLSPKIDGVINTDYKAALERANEELENLHKNNLRKLIIFLTDGEPDPDNIGRDEGLMKIYMEELWETVSKISKNNYPIYSIGFSQEIDVEILNRIAKETNGDVRIFQDASSLESNLIQSLKSREKIVDEFLSIPSKDAIDLHSNISTDFWLNDQGYRLGEEIVVSSAINIAGTRIQRNQDFLVDKFELIIDYDYGESFTIPLYDDGSREHGDINAEDGIWSNRIIFDKTGRARASLVFLGKFKGEPLSLEKDIGEYIVAEPGKILVESYEESLGLLSGERLVTSIAFNNQSDFREIVFIEIDEGLGTLIQEQIELKANWDGDVDITIIPNPNLERANYNLKIKLKPMNKSTTINKSQIEINLEIMSYFTSILRKVENNPILSLLMAGILFGLPLLTYLLGMIFYLTLVKSNLKIEGYFIYWKDSRPEAKEEFHMTNEKKGRIVITFNKERNADLTIENADYNHDLEINNILLIDRAKFILGWKKLLSKKGLISLVVSTTQPGIIQYRGDIFTKMNLYNEDIFSTGGFTFHYISDSKKAVSEEQGRNILEGRV